MCVYYICLLLYVVVYVIISMCVYDDSCVSRQVWGCLLDVSVAKNRGTDRVWANKKIKKQTKNKQTNKQTNKHTKNKNIIQMSTWE